MLEYLDKNKDSIKREVYRICKEEDIDYIFTLAKKGTFLFDIILPITSLSCFLPSLSHLSTLFLFVRSNTGVHVSGIITL